MKRNEAYFDKIFKAIKQDDRPRFRKLFLKLHEYDQLKALNLLYPEKKYKIYKFLSAEEFAEMFDLMEFQDQLEFFKQLPEDYLRDVLHYVQDDNVTDFVQGLSNDAPKALSIMYPHDRKMIESLLRHEDSTAAANMTTEVIKAEEDWLLSEVIDHIREVGEQSELIYYIYVVDREQHLKGVCSLKELLLSDKDKKISEIMNTQFAFVNLATDQEDVARLIQDYDLLAVPVLSATGELQGIVTVDDVMDVLDDEMTEDFHRFSGINPGEETDEPESIFQMTKARLPWIIILIFLGLISANLIKHFEATLEQVVALAAFMPIIMDSAGNVGTQSLAVSVRRLTIDKEDQGEGFLPMLFKELASGFFIGIFASSTLAILAYFLHHNWVLSVIIMVSLWITLTISTAIGFVVPWLFDKMHIDPAVASGPFITTINDACGLIIYFSLATYLLHML